MPEKEKKDATIKPTPGTAAAHQIEVDRLTLQNKRLQAKLDIAVEEANYSKKELKRIENDYRARVANTLKLDIQDVLGCTDVEIAKLTHELTVDQLEKMLEHVMLVRTVDPTTKDGVFKPIRTGKDLAVPTYGEPDNFTVGDLFGKKAEDIRKMKGEF